MNVKAVLWDMDGVIINSEKYYMQGTFEWMKQIGFTGDMNQICTIIGTTMDVSSKMLAEMMNNKYTAVEMRQFNDAYFLKNPIKYEDILNDNVENVLKYLKDNKIKIALCSSSPFKNIKHVLKVCNIEKYFDYIVSGEQFEKSKPNPEIYLSALKKLDVKNENCLVIEDSHMGINAGKNAQIYTIALKDKEYSIDQSDADVIIYELNQIIDIIKSSNY